MKINDLLEDLRFDTGFFRNVTAWEKIPAAAARYSPVPEQLNPALRELLNQRGFSKLYIHQAEAIGAVLEGENVVVSTRTASGKSLIYHLSALQAMMSDPAATSLAIFPTKALAQDQAASLSELLGTLPVNERPAVNLYDGDTASDKRPLIRRQGGIIITNPDMLHLGILPYHPRWEKFFTGLKVIVLDEIHSYRGAFGSHLANVIRRLKRICSFYGSSPLFICTSATIANPLEHARRLTQEKFVLVDEDGSEQGDRTIILYNPPEIDNQTGLRRSHLLEVRKIASRLLSDDLQMIVFAASRLKTEILLGYIRDDWKNSGHASDQIRGYRGGYLAGERRQIETGLREGTIRGVVATNALELGVDIGQMEAVVIAGYPGTIASTWQQFGRAGRRATSSLGILVASGMPMDQFLAKNPSFIFSRSPEHALIDPDNLKILINHLRCAAYELPFAVDEGYGPIEDVSDVMSVLADAGEIAAGPDLYRWISPQYPSAGFSLRTSANSPVIIQEEEEGKTRVIGEVDRISAPFLIYEGAVYLHEGEMYHVDTLDWQAGIAAVSRGEFDYYTVANTSSTLTVLEEFQSLVVGDCLKSTGRVHISSVVENYKLVKRYTHETLGYGDISLPPSEYATTAYWLSLTPDLTASLECSRILMKPNDYGPNWQSQRDKARQRDHYRCQICGLEEPSDHQHHVHHIKPFREFDYTASENENYLQANQLSNLMTLCPGCHRQIENQQRTRGALSGLRYLIHNLATLFLMCSPGDIDVVAETRSQFTGNPTITVFDRADEGSGFSIRLFDLHSDLLDEAYRVVTHCDCEAGCPACIGPIVDEGEKTKELTIALLEAVLSGEE